MVCKNLIIIYTVLKVHTYKILSEFYEIKIIKNNLKFRV